MEKTQLSARIVPSDPDAIAVFQDGLMVFANKTFEMLYNLLKYDVR